MNGLGTSKSRKCSCICGLQNIWRKELKVKRSPQNLIEKGLEYHPKECGSNFGKHGKKQ
jgi:hypothetical protein